MMPKTDLLVHFELPGKIDQGIYFLGRGTYEQILV